MTYHTSPNAVDSDSLAPTRCDPLRGQSLLRVIDASPTRSIGLPDLARLATLGEHATGAAFKARFAQTSTQSSSRCAWSARWPRLGQPAAVDLARSGFGNQSYLATAIRKYYA
ncbi:hypothetical protein [Burkholderia gladioli]|uniref:hypothetical protein n=1 Tax=Burkholderia gladioli TaxID=28095 RepID=UPI0011B20DB6|nr:hypothetical protein [Burkholderia gladioli]